jgi:hypothetical protein
MREQILDAIKTALGASTGIAYVTDKREAWQDWAQNRYPGVCILTGEEQDSRFCYSGTDNLLCTMPVEVIGCVFDKANNLGTKRSDLIGAIEKAIVGSTVLAGLIRDVQLSRVHTDQGIQDNYSVVSCTFNIEYLIDSAGP